MVKFVGKTLAPEFPAELTGFNLAAGAARLADCRGRLTLIYFWNGANLSAVAGLAKLNAARRQFGDALAVITAHSPRYRGERSERQVAAWVERYADGLAVLNDERCAARDALRVGDNPALVFVDPEGRFVTAHRGEFDADGLRRIVGAMLREYGLSYAPAAVETAKGRGTQGTKNAGALRFPDHLEVAGDKLYVADGGARRVVIGALSSDGAQVEFEDALDAVEGERLASPSGVAFDGARCYVGDGEIGGIFAFEPSDPRQAHWIAPPDAAILRGVADLEFYKGELFAALPLRRQIWRVDAKSGRLEAWVGAGKSGNWDDDRAAARLAQPLALAASGGLLFADSENNAVKVVNPAAQGRVVTLAGGGLHDWGDYDAVAGEARFQHPRGVAWADDKVYIADTLNHKIKQMDIKSLQVSTRAGSGEAGWRDGDAAAAQFNNPSAIKAVGDKLYIADTHNRADRILNLTANQVATFK